MNMTQSSSSYEFIFQTSICSGLPSSIIMSNTAFLSANRMKRGNTGTKT
jgi:hypothetical protein